MPYYPKKPKLTHEDVIREIYNRTNYPINAIYQILWCYNDICHEALLNEVEVPVGDVGYLSWKQINPREDVTVWCPWKKAYDEHRNIPGFRKTSFRINGKWHQELKQATIEEPWIDREKKENENE